MTRPLLLAAILTSAALTGCSAVPAQPAQTTALTPSTQPTPAGTGVDFWYALARKRSVTADEATRALLSHLDDPAAAEPYPARVEQLKAKGYLPRGFSAGPDALMPRGDFAVAVCRTLNLKGGLTSRLAGLTPRYATRELVFQGLYPESTPNQGFTGAEFVGIIGALDDRRRGNPADVPADEIPGYREPTLALDGTPVYDYRVLPLILAPPPEGEVPVYQLMQDGTAQPAGATTQGVARKLRVFVTAVQGDQVEFRRKPDAAWEKARVGLVLDENAEFRTGDKSSVQLRIPPGQTFTLDRLGTAKVAEAAFDGTKVKTDIAMEQGRVRMDINPTSDKGKAQLERIDVESARVAEAGVVHDTQIRSPNSALAVRGTQVSLLDQAPYPPIATSLTGRASYLNTRRQIVAFGAAGRKAKVQGDQTGAGENAEVAQLANIPPASMAAQFDAQQLNRVLSFGGFLRGDVVVGNAAAEPADIVPGAPLAFVLTWGKPGDPNFQDLNLAVFSPLDSAANPDFVGNGPFTTALNPQAPGYQAFRAANFPLVSRSGGAVSRNAVSAPDKFTSRGNTSAFGAAEFAVWPTSFPQGRYTVVVTNFADAGDANIPGKGSDPVDAIVSVISNGRSIGTLTGRDLGNGDRTLSDPVGQYQSFVKVFDTNQIPPTSTNLRPASTKGKGKR